MLFALALFVILGFGALAIDISYIRMCQSQAQDVADAASQAALVVLRHTGDADEAAAVAHDLVRRNLVGGQVASVEELSFGIWDESAGGFQTDSDVANAVRVRVGRKGGNSVPFILGRLFGFDRFEVEGRATSATRNLHVVLVMDITNSWNPVNFEYSRDAAIAFLDVIRDAPGPYDKIGMTVFTNRYGWEFTPMTSIIDNSAIDGTRTQWMGLKTASKAGNGDNWPLRCATFGNNDFSSPAGGCYANMPREYTDEPGTDHTTGMEMAAIMFDEDPDPNAFRVMIVLTDGQPNGIGSTSGTIRAAQGYTEDRWREYVGPAPHSGTDIRWDSIQVTSDMWSAARVHTYVVSFVADDWFMHDMPTGQGYYILTDQASALVPIFQEIAGSLPIALVE